MGGVQVYASVDRAVEVVETSRQRDTDAAVAVGLMPIGPKPLITRKFACVLFVSPVGNLYSPLVSRRTIRRTEEEAELKTFEHNMSMNGQQIPVGGEPALPTPVAPEVPGPRVPPVVVRPTARSDYPGQRVVSWWYSADSILYYDGGADLIISCSLMFV